MKIALHMFCNGPFGGAERRLVRAYSRLALRQPVELFIRETSRGLFTKEAVRLGIDLSAFSAIKLSSSSKSALLDAMDLAKSLKSRCDVHIAFDYSRYNLILFRALKSLRRAATVCSLVDGTYAPSGYSAIGIDQPVSEDNLRRLLGCSDVIDLLYPQQKSYYENLLGSEALIRITPGTFTDLERYRPLPKKKLISFVSARLDAAKNPDLFIDSIACCADALRSHGYVVEVCGQGDDLDRLRSKTVSLHITDLVSFPGYVDTAEQLGKSEVVCLCGASGQYPSQVLAEGAACGCFVIATKALLVEDPTEGVLAPGASSFVECDAAAIADSLALYMALPPEVRVRVPFLGRAFADIEFSIEKSVDYFEEVCREASLKDQSFVKGHLSLHHQRKRA